MPYDNKNWTLENVRLIFCNFAGAPTRFNTAGGVRTFCVLLDQETAAAMYEEGWPIKTLNPREEGDPEQPYMQVKLKYGGKGRPPRVVMITSRGRTSLDEDMVGVLDWADRRNVDLIVRPYAWDINGKQGVTAYLQSIYITIEEDELELKYADVEELDNLPSRSGRVDEGYEEPF